MSELILPTLAPESFKLANITIYNTWAMSLFVVVIFAIAALAIRGKIKVIPSGFQNFLEIILDVLLDFCDQVTHSRRKSLQLLPIVGGSFLFILLGNWMGLVPGVGSIGQYQAVHGKIELIPVFRGANTDLNMTLALAVFGVIASHVLGVMVIGAAHYFNKFFKYIDIFSALKKGPLAIFQALVELMVGIIEVFSEVAKMASLSLRLFGNVFAGEVLLTVIASLISIAGPLPFIFLELIVGIVQATVFATLILVYMNLATAESH